MSKGLRFIDMSGEKRGMLLILEPVKCIKKHGDKDPGFTYKWLCRCDCGKEVVKPGSYLRHKKSKALHSCGCRSWPVGKEHKLFKGFEEITGDYWYICQTGAKNRNLEFNISIEDAWSAFVNQNRKCALSGLDINFRVGTQRTSATASLDRIDSSKGYILDNVQWVHKDINRLKMNLPEGRFIELCEAVAIFRGFTPPKERQALKDIDLILQSVGV